MRTPRHWLSELTSPMMALSSSPSNECRSGSGGKNVQNATRAMRAIATCMRKVKALKATCIAIAVCICWCRWISLSLSIRFDFTRASASELKPCECACRSPRDRDMLMDGQAWAPSVFFTIGQFCLGMVLTDFHAVKSLACSSLLVIVHPACRIGWLSNGDDLLAPVSKACYGAMECHATCAQPVPRFVRCGSVLLASRAYGPCHWSV